MSDNNRKLRIFLCHSSNDKPAVRELYQRLEDEGWIDPWLDEEKLYPGQDWDLEIEKAVEAADAVIVFLSNNSVTKEGYVQRELRFVLRIADFKPEGTVFVIPVRLDDCPMPRRLSMWQYVDYFPENRKDWAYKRLFGSLQIRANLFDISRRNSGTDSVIESAEKYSPSGFPLYTFGGIEFVKVPAGVFTMGSNDKDVHADNDEKPQHVVDIPYDYYISRCSVTNQQYADYMVATNAKHPIVKWEKKRNHPVVTVLWNDAMTYCNWLENLMSNKLPTGLSLRLPTEAEWEKASRGKRGTIYPWGDIFDKNLCNTNESEIGSTTPVGMYSPQADSPFGCADMSGNVWEWTHSLFKPYPYKVDDGREDAVVTGDRVIRGGSFRRLSGLARCASRAIAREDNPDIGGFRIVMSKSLY